MAATTPGPVAETWRPRPVPGGILAFEAVEAMRRQFSAGPGRTAALEDVGNVAAFVASDRARTMTAATANVSCCALVD